MATEVLAPGVVDKRVEQELVRSLKRTYDMFRASGDPTELVDESAAAPARALRLASKIGDEYAPCVGLAPPQAAPASRRSRKEGAASKALASSDSKPGVAKAAATAAATEEAGEDLKKAAEMAARIRDGGAPPAAQQASSALIVVPEAAARQEDDESAAPGRAASASASGVVAKWVPPVLAGKPEWHAPWKLFRVVSGHLGWVRSITVDPSNDWFATGSADRTIKIWDVASGSLRLTLTGHIGTVRGLQVSARHPYLFSCADDKKVLCWDLEYNKVVRHYHGHLSGVYCLSLHPTLDVLATGGRDSAVRVWDVRTKNQIFCLSGHQNTVWSVAAQASEPQIVSGSMDSTIKFWDLAAGKCMTTLTHHKKGVRALATHHTENAMMSGAADNLKKWRFPMGEFLGNFTGHNAIVNSVAISRDNVVVSGGDNGTLHFWDWKTGYNFQQEQVKPQPGSLESEAGIYAMAFDQSSLRLITCEADKSIKMWKPDDEATPETHPVKNWRQQLKAQRATY